MSSTETNLGNHARAITEAGEHIYRAKFQDEFEEDYHGQYCAIEVTTETATVAGTLEDALIAAQRVHPEGVFHLIRVGFPSALQMGYERQHGEPSWSYQ